jgi:large subunit ribosomal protein L29
MEDLRALEADELAARLRTARRELYELRFKHAVGQLENASQIGKVRHDIARIMTVLRQRDFGIVASSPVEEPVASKPVEKVEKAVEPQVEEAAEKPKARRSRKKEAE